MQARGEAGWPHTLFILYKNNANPKKIRIFAVGKRGLKDEKHNYGIELN